MAYGRPKGEDVDVSVVVRDPLGRQKDDGWGRFSASIPGFGFVEVQGHVGLVERGEGLRVLGRYDERAGFSGLPVIRADDVFGDTLGRKAGFAAYLNVHGTRSLPAAFYEAFAQSGDADEIEAAIRHGDAEDLAYTAKVPVEAVRRWLGVLERDLGGAVELAGLLSLAGARFPDHSSFHDVVRRCNADLELAVPESAASPVSTLLEAVRADPYRLVGVLGTTWRQADNVRRGLGYSHNCAVRCDALVVEAARRSVGNGDTAVPESAVVDLAQKIDPVALEASRQHLWQAVQRCKASRKLVSGVVSEERAEEWAAGHGERFDATGMGAVGVVQAYAVAMHEHRLADRVTALMQSGQRRDPEEVARALRYRLDDGRCPVPLDEAQQRAVVMGVTEPVSLITGGGGSGKSTLFGEICALSEAFGETVYAAAPSATAALRLGELGIGAAGTLHRTLGADFSGNWKFGRDNPLVGPCLLGIDEMSMVDMPVAAQALSAVPVRSGRILMQGDADQLESIEMGRVFRDLLEWGRIPTARLERVYRQKDEVFLDFASEVLAGRMPDLPIGVYEGGIKVLPCTGGEIADAALEVIRSEFASHVPGDELVALAPFKEGPGGAAEINQRLQEFFNPEGVPVRKVGVGGGGGGDALLDVIPRVGDPIVNLGTNDVQFDLFRGDLGRVLGATSRYADVMIPGRGVRRLENDALAGDRRRLIAPAYCLTGHRVQGLQRPVTVVCLADRADGSMGAGLLTRNMLYTLTSRWRARLVIVGEPSAIERCVMTPGDSRRLTLLNDRLEHCWGERERRRAAQMAEARVAGAGRTLAVA